MVGEAGSFECFLICNDSLAALLGRHPLTALNYAEEIDE